MSNIQTPKKFLIVQLARTGDILQTLIAARAFRNNHPEIELDILCRSKYVGPVRKLLKDTFNRIFELDKAKIFKETDVDGIINRVDDFINVINAQQHNVVINQSYCKTSFYITALIKSKNKIGSHYGKDHVLNTNDVISQYINNFVVNSSLNSFNLSELWATNLGDFDFKQNVHVTSQKNILIHPFASQERKHWKNSKWVEIIYSLLKSNEEAKIMICGAGPEQELATALKNDPLLTKYKKRIEIWAGMLSVEELYENMDNIALFVGHDSMVSHLASLKNVPSITFPLGSVRPHETFPMTAGALIVTPKVGCFPCYADQKCEDYVCHTDVSHQLVSEIILSSLNGTGVNLNVISSKIGQYHASSANIYQVEKRSTGRFQLTSVQETVTTRTVMRDLFNVLWSFKLFEDTPLLELPKISATTTADLQRVKSAITNLFELAEFGKKYCSYILKELNLQSPSLEKINSHSAKIDEIDSLTKLISKSANELIPLINFYEVQKANTPGVSIVEITENTYLIYHDLSISCSVFSELLDKVLAPQIKNKISTHQGR